MRSVEVQILGQSYSIKTDEEEEYIKTLAKYIDEKLKEIYNIVPSITQTKATVMAAFGIADEVFKIKMQQEDLDKLVDENTNILSGFLDS